MVYRTKTYIAGAWDEDNNAIEQLKYWNNSSHWALDFNDAHELKNSRDTSLNCTIKRSLRERLNASKTFVLIVGNQTKSLKSGSCSYCKKYDGIYGYCLNNYSVDFRSYIDFECDIASKDIKNIIILYNSKVVSKQKCPDSVKYLGTHLPMLDPKGNWNYQPIKNAFALAK